MEWGRGGGARKTNVGGFEVKNFNYIYGLLKGNHSMERKIIEYGIIFLHKYKREQSKVISRLLFTFYLQVSRIFGQIEYLHFPNRFSYFFHSYEIMSLGNIHPIPF